MGSGSQAQQEDKGRVVDRWVRVADDEDKVDVDEGGDSEGAEEVSRCCR